MKIKNRKYNIGDYFYIPLKVSAVHTLSVILLKVTHAIMPTIILWATSVFVDGMVKRVEGTIENRQVVFCFFILLLLIAGREFVSLLYSLAGHKLECVMQDILALGIVEKRSRVEYMLMEDKEAYERMERMQEEPAKKWLEGMYNMLEMFAYAAEAAGVLIIIGRYQIMVSIFVAFLLIPFFVLSIKNGEVEYEAYEDSSKSFIKARYLRNLLMSKDTLEERYLFNFTPYVNKLWHQEYCNAINIEKKANKIIFSRVTMGNLGATFFSCCIMAVLIIPVLHSSMTIGIYMALVKAILDFVDSISWRFAQLILKIQKNMMYLKDFSIFACYDEIEEEKGGEVSEIDFQDKITIEFKMVTFFYPGAAQPVLKDFSLKVECGKKYVLVGINGSGKTTLIKLLMKLYTDYRGEILINDRDIRTIHRTELRNYYSIVLSSGNRRK